MNTKALFIIASIVLSGTLLAYETKSAWEEKRETRNEMRHHQERIVKIPWEKSDRMLSEEEAQKTRGAAEKLKKDQIQRNFTDQDVDNFFWKMAIPVWVKEDKLFLEAAKNYVLLFFYEPYNDDIHTGELYEHSIPLVKNFADSFQFKLIAITYFGSEKDLFKGIEVRPDNGISKKVKIERYPYLVLVDPKKETFKQVALSFESEECLLSSIRHAIEELDKQEKNK